MAKKKKTKKEKPAKKEEALATVKFSRKNTIFFGIGLVLVVIGFILLAAGDIVLAPILLIVGYLVFFPLGILLK
ncbi:MAG: hypothetical protein JSV53_12045 [candidate division WOR-3 bacterium]|nr:MAG: hypothetical protein JSV53_12045 [candidate division WOR-3 bacterium]